MTIAPIRIDLRSDTKSRPTEAMRRAMAAAEVGDEQSAEDPSVNALCERVADLLGKEAAVFLPSGTMCNAIAVAVHCRPGDEIIADVCSHLFNTEAAGSAALAGAQIRPVQGHHGRFTAADVRAALRGPKKNAPRSRLIAVEQTVNRGGGAVWSLAALQEIGELARRECLALHMDGARLINAVVASGVAASDFGAPCDSVWLDLSKGLGCPVGAVLAGSRELIAEAWRWKHRLGGAMRQAGILAAAGLFALDHHVERLAEDHANAKLLAEGLRNVPGIALDQPQPETNLVFFDVAGMSAPELSKHLRAEGIAIGAESHTRLRAVTHLDVDSRGIATAVSAIARIMKSAAPPTPQDN
ncbi:MAG: aminotransferase class V-fold PLP-dependent enzyme [Hyphomicrobiaceae bacterium]|nr:aminotransferase class V-fold PLP-dependent enzyme [Hyphomicrobiaceae bacterium]